MERVKPRTLAGFMELLPERQQLMEKMMEKLRESYSLYGFTPLDTPIIEASEVLLAKGGGETEKQIYRFLKGDTDLSMRFDLTVPLAKYVSMHHGTLTFPFRRFQIGKVYRGERTQRGRFREFYQADIDIIGDGTLEPVNEAEIPSIIYKTFTSLGLRRFKIKVNNRMLLNGFFEYAGVTNMAQIVMREIDKLDKQGREKTLANLAEACGAEAAEKILGFIEISGSAAEKIDAISKYSGCNERFDAGYESLRALVGYLADFGVPEENFELDFAIARGLDYYTGTVYETILTDHPEIGSICSGGRYDNLAEYYTDRALPGVGISIGLTRLFYVLETEGYLNDEIIASPADALVIPMTDDLGFAIKAATAIRSAGVRASIYFEKKKFKAKIGYADKLGIPYAIFIGEDEIASGTITVKQLATGNQWSADPGVAAARIAEELAPRRAAAPIKDKVK